MILRVDTGVDTQYIEYSGTVQHACVYLLLSEKLSNFLRQFEIRTAVSGILGVSNWMTSDLRD